LEKNILISLHLIQLNEWIFNSIHDGFRSVVFKVLNFHVVAKNEQYWQSLITVPKWLVLSQPIWHSIAKSTRHWIVTGDADPVDLVTDESGLAMEYHQLICGGMAMELEWRNSLHRLHDHDDDDEYFNSPWIV